MSNKSKLKVRMEFSARVFMGDELLGDATQVMGFPDKRSVDDNEQVVISLGEGQVIAAEIAKQCANVAIYRSAYDLRRSMDLERDEIEKAEMASAKENVISNVPPNVTPIEVVHDEIPTVTDPPVNPVE